MQSSRLWFLQAARGLACLMIVVAHWIGFLRDPDWSAPFVHQEGIQSGIFSVPGIISFLKGISEAVIPAYFNAVYFSLGLFFLISGYVIPLSMGNGSQIQYLVRRLLRIYPVVFATMLITLVVAWLGRWLDGLNGAPLSAGAVIANLLLLRDVMLDPFIDNGLWTLEVEMHFYVLCFFIGWNGGHKLASVILVVTAVLCACAFFAGIPSLENTISGVLLNVAGLNSCFITLMLVGTVLYNGTQGGWGLKKTILMTVLVMSANKFCLSSFHQMDRNAGAIMFVNHVTVLGLFAILMIAAGRLPYLRLLDVLAKVSYPLYLLHGGAAYIVFFITFKSTQSSALACSAALIVTASLTYLIHRYVENPGVRAGKWFAGRLAQSPDG